MLIYMHNIDAAAVREAIRLARWAFDASLSEGARADALRQAWELLRDLAAE